MCLFRLNWYRTRSDLVRFVLDKIRMTGKTSSERKGTSYSCRSPNLFHCRSLRDCSMRCFSERWFDSSSDLLIRCLDSPFFSCDAPFLFLRGTVVTLSTRFFRIICPLNQRRVSSVYRFHYSFIQKARNTFSLCNLTWNYLWLIFSALSVPLP